MVLITSGVHLFTIEKCLIQLIEPRLSHKMLAEALTRTYSIPRTKKGIEGYLRRQRKGVTSGSV